MTTTRRILSISATKAVIVSLFLLPGSIEVFHCGFQSAFTLWMNGHSGLILGLLLTTLTIVGYFESQHARRIYLEILATAFGGTLLLLLNPFMYGASSCGDMALPGFFVLPLVFIDSLATGWLGGAVAHLQRLAGAR